MAITISAPSISHHLSLEETLARLSTSPLVDGVAAFGSRAISQGNAASDYDLLVLVKQIPARVFQMVTTIDGRLADIVLVEIETADDLLTTQEPAKPRTFEALFLQKMQTANILYDASGRLQSIQQLVTSPQWPAQTSPHRSDPDLYAAWFWQSFGLLHLERMARSTDPVHLTAVDMMLTSCLSGTWRSYFDLRGIPWVGEKAALRYWGQKDIEYLSALRNCLESTDRNEKLATYRKLVERTLEPIGKVFDQGQTAVILARENTSAEVQAVLEYWQSLIAP